MCKLRFREEKFLYVTLFNTRRTRFIDNSYLAGGIVKLELNQSLSHSKSNLQANCIVIQNSFFLLLFLQLSPLLFLCCFLYVAGFPFLIPGQSILNFLSFAWRPLRHSTTTTSIYSLSSHCACYSVRANFQKRAYTA